MEYLHNNVWRRLFVEEKEFVYDAEPIREFDLLGPVGEKLLMPTCISASESGEFVVTDKDSCFIIIYNSTGEYLSHFSTLPKQLFYFCVDIERSKPHDVAWLSSKRIVYTQPKGCKVVVSNWVGTQSLVIQGKPLYEPYGVCVDSMDKIYITDREKGRLLCYNCDGKLLRSIGMFASSDILTNPQYVQVRPNGDIYVNETHKGQARIKVYGEKRTQSFTIPQSKGELGCMTVDDNGNILVVNTTNNSLTVCTKDILRHDSDDDCAPKQLALARQLGGITINNKGELACLDKIEKKIYIYRCMLYLKENTIPAGNRFLCEDCGQTFFKGSQLSKHKMKIHDEMIRCGFCSYNVTKAQMSAMDRHECMHYQDLSLVPTATTSSLQSRNGLNIPKNVITSENNAINALPPNGIDLNLSSTRVVYPSNIVHEKEYPRRAGTALANHLSKIRKKGLPPIAEDSHDGGSCTDNLVKIFCDTSKTVKPPNGVTSINVGSAKIPEYSAQDPRFFFLGAPSSYIKEHTAQILKAAKMKAVEHLDRYTRHFIPLGFLGVKRVEKVQMPDGHVYQLSEFWTRDPEFKETKNSAIQTDGGLKMHFEHL